MSGGISAIRGFDYQATVILDLLFQHFERCGPTALVRPEGEDDLDLRWIDAGIDRHCFIQVKKPREDALARPKPCHWSLADFVRDLLPDVLTRLAGNEHGQHFVLGDPVTSQVRALFDAGVEAPSKTPTEYWAVIHSLARAQAQKLLRSGSVAARAASTRRVPKQLPDEPMQALATLVSSADTFARRHGARGRAFSQRYAQEAERVHGLLPSILERTKVFDANGSEEEVADRVMQRLERRYLLPRSVVEDTLFRNLRGFINDIAKQPGRSFDHDEMETELRCVWPHMVPIKAPPPLEGDHIGRPSLAMSFIDPWAGVATEVIGISGAGKTRLATEIIERSKLVHSERAVLYAEVRSGTSLRDCLVGAAFSFRRRGLPEPFAISIQPHQSNEGALMALAKAFSSMPDKALLLLDLVEGSEPPGFARDIATFVRTLPSNTLRLIVFGQERLLRELTLQEQTQLGVSSVDAPGLSYEEFVSLVKLHHAAPDRGELWDLYHQITAGRAAGLNVSLAQAFARAETAKERASIAARPANERLAYAEQSRFNRVSSGVRAAAEKLMCFALPFTRSNAEEVFPRDNVGMAIRELLDLGLLRRHGGEALEMHETVRAGLEELLAPQTRLDAHGALANWYRTKEQTGAVVFHLEKSDQGAQAQAEARKAFLAGESWTALWPFVVRHGLMSGAELIAVVAGGRNVEGAYLLSTMLKELEDSSVIGVLMDLVRTQTGRLFADYQWAGHILEAILAIEPSQLDALIDFLVKAAPSPRAMADVFSALSFAARRQRAVIGPSTLTLFHRQSEPVQEVLLAFLMQGGRSTLRYALHHLWRHPSLVDPEHGGWPKFHLDIRTAEDVSDLLMALPTVEPAEMIRTRGPCLGPLGGLIWRARKVLHAPCVAVLKAQSLDGSSLSNAIRVLLFLGESAILALCEGLKGRDDAAGTLAKLIPAVVPALVDWHPYEACVRDQAAEFDDRVQAMLTLAWSGRRLESLLEELRTNDSENWPRWIPALRLIAGISAFAAAAPILAEALESDDDKGIALLSSIINRQGQTPGSAMTKVLMQGLVHRDERVRLGAALALVRRRDRAALSRLVERYPADESTKVQVILATAILASGATTAANLGARSNTSAADLWWCVLAHRTRDISAADRLVALATDRDRLWSVRRAAIAAAGRLPYEAVLSRIEIPVMGEQSPFGLDGHRSLVAHSALMAFLPHAEWKIRQLYHGKRDDFVDYVQSYFDGFFKTIDPTGLPSSRDAAVWLYDALVDAQGSMSESTEQLQNALHVPLLQAAVLRALRIQGRVDRVDAHLAAANHTWVAMRALLERAKFSERGHALSNHLQGIAAGAAWANDRVVIETMHRLFASPMDNLSSSKSGPPEQAPSSVLARFSYKTACDLLAGSFNGPVAEGPMVLYPLEAQECEMLIRLADPQNDPERGEIAFIPGVSFSNGGHQVTQTRTTYRGGPSCQERLRKAIAAANRFGLPMVWHKAQLEGAIGESYASDFLGCLAAQGDAARFYAALAESEAQLMPVLCKNAYALSAQLEIDCRFIPSLTRFLHVGGDDVFQGLCILAKRIDTPEIQPVLEGLLYRWSRRFDMRAVHAQNDEAFALWHGFARLNEHPRFDAIPDWPQQLEATLRAPMAWYHAQSIVRVLERDAGSYVLIEARLFKEENWEHYHEDEVERLDRAAEALFGQTQDTSAC